MINLRDYQQQMVDETRNAFAQGHSRVLLVAPTGSGKGSIASYIIDSARNKGSRIIFLVNRRELVKDMSKRLTRLGIHHGILMGAQTRGSHLPVQIASVDTLRNRIDKIKAPELVFVDEAHLFVSERTQELMTKLTEAGTRVILMTATPCRLDGKGLKEIADTMVLGPSVVTLIEQGHLVQPVVYAPSAPDLSEVKKVRGEFNQEAIAEVMSSSRLVGDIVSHWKELAEGRKTVVFAVNRKHAKQISDSFNAAGVRSVTVDANTPDAERNRTWKELASGELPVVCSVGIISFGWDVPEVDCVILARPTLSKALHLQQCGRGLRPSEGKSFCLILDHAGNTLRHGLPEDPQRWTLEGRTKRGGVEEEAEIAALPRVCPKCAKVVKSRASDCDCGYEFTGSNAPAREIKTEAGTLVRVESRVTFSYPETNGDVGRDSLIGIAAAKGYHPGWINHRERLLQQARAEYKAVFGEDAKAHWNSGMIQSMVKRANEKLEQEGRLSLLPRG